MFDKSRSFLLHRMIFCKKCLHKQFFPQNGGTLGYKYLFRLKDHYSPIECIPSFFVVLCICLINHVLFCSTGRYFVKKCLHKQFFLKMVEIWDINIYFVWKTTIVPLRVYGIFSYVMCICLTNHVLFLLHRTIFCKKCLHKQFFLKMVEPWDINIYFVWKDQYSPLQCMSSFFLL